jgi:hypothetical protein
MAPRTAQAVKRKQPGGKRHHYRDAGFLPHAFVNFVSAGLVAQDDREVLSRRD